MTSNKDAEKEREDLRKSSLSTLDNPVYAAYASALNSRKGYGENGRQAVHNFLYVPTLAKDGRIAEMLMGSREDGELYSGNLREMDILKYGSQIIEEAIGNLRVGDLINKIGYKGKELDEYKGIWVSDLLKSKKASDVEMIQKMMGVYFTQLTDRKVSESLNLRAKSMGQDLEKIVKKG